MQKKPLGPVNAIQRGSVESGMRVGFKHTRLKIVLSSATEFKRIFLLAIGDLEDLVSSPPPDPWDGDRGGKEEG
ncbi:hypothetical protein J2129_001418 [Methanofollis sp. W23]|nr:hypothetical protein [Methanofollis sp. W23]